MSSTKNKLLRDTGTAIPLIGVISYIAVTYIGGWWLLNQSSLIAYSLGVLSLGHSMVIAGYLLHECAHNSLFINTKHNTALGKVMNAICGSNYGTYEDIRNKHMRHHIDNCDTVSFDYRTLLKKSPLLLNTFKVLEWAYIPAVEMLMHGRQMIQPFLVESTVKERFRVSLVLLTRLSLLAIIAWFAPLAFVGYVIAYLLFITVLRFMDNFQHDYELYYKLGDTDFVPPMKGNSVYEQTHTYSNLLSQNCPIINLLTLNFSYHNAHHAKPTAAWFRLPKIHEEMILKQDVKNQNVIFWEQLISFHRQRVARVLSEEYGKENLTVELKQGKAVGVNAVSFLIPF